MKKKVTSQLEKWVKENYPDVEVTVEENPVIKGSYREVIQIPGGKKTMINHGSFKTSSKKELKELKEIISQYLNNEL